MTLPNTIHTEEAVMKAYTILNVNETLLVCKSRIEIPQIIDIDDQSVTFVVNALLQILYVFPFKIVRF